jgi:hypothetical protein
MNFLGLELNDKIQSTIPGFYVGASAGLVSFDGTDAFLPGVDDLYFGPKIGMLNKIARDLSLGFETKLLFLTSSPLIAWVDLLGSIHYHF